MNIKPIARNNDLVIQETGDELLIYDLKTNKAYCLNETSALIWKLCDGNHSAKDISDEMSRKFKTLIYEDFVYIGLDQLGKDGLLEGDDENYFGGLSRREVIRKVGFGAVTTLPIISTVVAPQASRAQSGGAVLSLCTGPVTGSSCDIGLFCVQTITQSIATGGATLNTQTGNNQCCINAANVVSGTRCINGSCAGVNPTCDGSAWTNAPVANPICTGLGFNTCTA